MSGRAWTGIDEDRPLRHAVEVRHSSFENENFLSLATEYGIAAVVADTAGTWPAFRRMTADFGYLRLHGAQELYVSGYDDDALDSWARLIATWAPRDMFVYFDNDVKVRAPFDAMSLSRRIKEITEG